MSTFAPNIYENKLLMNKKALQTVILALGMMTAWATDGAARSVKSASIIKQHIYADYKQMYKKPEGGALLFPYLTPGSKSYAAVLWDWD
jgi:putative isomerase